MITCGFGTEVYENKIVLEYKKNCQLKQVQKRFFNVKL